MDFRNVFSAVDDVIGNVRDLLNEVASQVDNCMATVERSLVSLVDTVHHIYTQTALEFWGLGEEGEGYEI